MIGKRVAMIGAGNVMMDIAHWLVRDLKVEEVVAVVRRGPADVKFSKKEMEIVARNLDLDDLDREIARTVPVLEAVGQDAAAAKDFILSALPKALEPVSKTRFRFDFLAMPTRILGDESGNVCGLEVENTTLMPSDGDTKSKGLGTRRVVNVDTVIFCIGDRVDDEFGLPIQWNEFVKNPAPRFPIDGLSYEAYDLENAQPVERVFVAGWSREASSGLVGVARKDGENGARAVLQYLQNQPGLENEQAVIEGLAALLHSKGKPLVTKEEIIRLEAYEQGEAGRLGVEEFKLKTNEEMLAAIGLI
jgi:ferredoxin--NADP+ reductase